MSQDNNHHASSCSTCAQSKVQRHFQTGKLMPLPTPHRPWSHIAVDFITDIPESEGSTAILTVADKFSRGLKLFSLPALPSTFGTIIQPNHPVLRHAGGHGVHSSYHKSGQPSWRVTLSLTSGYHPQSNGQVERSNQEIERYLHTYCASNQNDWAKFQPWVEYAQNSLIHFATNMTLLQCILGSQPPLFPWNTETEVPADDDWFHHSEGVWESAHQ